MDKVLARIDFWKQKLVDLSHRNRLLYFQPGRRTALRVVQPSAEAVFDRIAVDESDLTVWQPASPEASRDSNEAHGALRAEASDVPGNILKVDGLNPRPKVNEIVCSLQDATMLGRTLRNLLRRSRTDFEERGLRILHLTFGMLYWQETGTSEAVRAPLVLVPVELTRESARDPYRLGPCEEEPLLNPALEVKLGNDFGLQLPAPPADWEVGSLAPYLEGMQEAVGRLGWTVSPEVWLGLFSFQKLVMYRDLDAHAKLMATHPTIRALGGEPDARGNLGADLPNERQLDSTVDPRQSFLIADADSSQLACIEAVKAGTSLVIQGPPGTGKSQTITNIVAESIANGRTVLFVSEKMAALEVVHKRLRDRGLGPLALELHSQKANKREVVQELERCYRQRLESSNEMSEVELDRLMRRRKELNEYVDALHVVRQPLQQSAFEVLGRLARLHNVRLVGFRFRQVAELTPQRLDALVDVGSRLARVWSVTLEGDTYPWRGCRETVYSNEVRQRVDRLVSEALLATEELGRAAGDYATALGLKTPETPVRCRWLAELGELLVERRPVEPSWFIGDPERVPLARTAANRCATYHNLATELAMRYRPEFFDLETDLAERLRAAAATLAERLGGRPADDPLPLNLLTDIVSWASDLEARIADWVRGGDLAATLMGMPAAPWTLLRLRQMVHLVDLVTSGAHPDPGWFEPTTRQRVQTILPQLRTDLERQAALRAQLSDGYFPERLLELDLDALLQAFAGRYTSVLRYLQPRYYRDRALVARCTRTGAAPLDCRAQLAIAREWKELLTAMERTFPSLEQLLGSHFRGFATDTEAVVQALQAVADLLELLGDSTPPDPLLQILSGRRNLPAALVPAAARLRESMDAWERGTEHLSGLLPLNRFPGCSSSIELVESDELAAWAAGLSAAAAQLAASVAPLESAASAAALKPVASFLADLDRLAEMRRTAAALASQEPALRKAFGAQYAGLDTSWNTLLDALAWVERIRSRFSGPPPAAFVAIVSRGDLPELQPLSSALLRWQQAVEQWLDRFVDGWPRFATWAGWEASIGSLCEGLRTLLDRIDGLQEWIDFKSLRDDLAQSGLSELLAELERDPPPASQLTDVLHKAVLQAWTDWLFASVPALRRFRAGEHEERIREFREMDVRHWELGANRVAARAARAHPQTGQTYAGGEIHTLLREANKKKRHMPLRRLFQEIPNLLQRLKPVLLMSPLSVSQFLQPEQLKFDVVVFDEASQIYPEDAVAAIYRGRQLVVCGDKKQLPPTAFFQLVDEDDEYREDDADDETSAEFDSILDECVALGMPERRLRWHYRSRHESLIAFSNRQFYESDLVTFPSHVQDDPELGIHLVHVADGIYDRGGRRDNRIEAARVTDFVLDHFRRWPDRSLGVIAFSQAQADAIEDSIEERRSSGAPFVYPAAQDRLEGFFVKNLENVQGDERDVIIFSVGYGRDRMGRMTMNFGPLNASGGERRLNVAITRAREKVLLVSSIRAEDIDAGAARAGVRQLRKYLDYAERGIDALEMGAAGESEPESPLEVAVAGAIREMGYDVVPQVGCSGFRIDIGVIDPARPGRYLLGVECDGRAYHSSATARDRDRLRQEVLERLGWRIHRVWSPDWIHRRTSEVERLQHAIEAAAAQPLGSPHRNTALVAPRPIMAQPPEPEGSWTTPYRCAQIVVPDTVTPEFHLPEYRALQARLLREIVATEGPIHIEVATRRILDAWGLKRAGGRIQRCVRDVAADGHGNLDLIQRGEFLWPPDMRDVTVVRVPAPNDPRTMRKVEHIAPEEIALAMVSIAQSAVGIRAEALVTETARIFGFAKTGSSIHAELAEILRSLVESGRLSDAAGHVSAANT